jgi:hypothetical protein
MLRADNGTMLHASSIQLTEQSIFTTNSQLPINITQRLP